LTWEEMDGNFEQLDDQSFPYTGDALIDGTLNIDFTDTLSFHNSDQFDEEVPPLPFVGDFMGFKGLTGGVTVYSGIFNGSIDEVPSTAQIRTISSSNGFVSEVFGNSEVLGRDSIFFYPDVDGELFAIQESIGYNPNADVAYWSVLKLNDSFEQVVIGMSSNSTGVSIDNNLSDDTASIFTVFDNNNDSQFSVKNLGVFLPNLPTADPLTTNQLWSDGGTLKVSAGPT
jgi:hypothetical protein